MSEEDEDYVGLYEDDDESACGGRPPLFNSERAARVIEAVRRGLTYKQAAAYGGVSYSTLNRWRKLGKDAEDVPELEEFWEFWKQLEQANGEAALRLVDCVSSAAEDGDWKAASWLMERRYRDEWGRNAPPISDPTESIQTNPFFLPPPFSP